MFYEYVGKHYCKIATGHYAQVLYGDENVEKSDRVMADLRASTLSSSSSSPSSIIEVGEDTIINATIEEKSSGNPRSLQSIRRDVINTHETESNKLVARLVMEHYLCLFYLHCHVLTPHFSTSSTIFYNNTLQKPLAKRYFYAA